MRGTKSKEFCRICSKYFSGESNDEDLEKSNHMEEAICVVRVSLYHNMGRARVRP